MKRMYTVIAILLAFLGVAYFNENGGIVKQAKPKVGVLTLMHHPALDQIYKGFVHGLAEEGYHNGKNITIDYQNANGDQSNLKTMANKLVNENSTVLFGITTPASQALANSTKKIPIVLGAVTNPQGAGLVKNNKRPGGNVTGISDQAPVKEQLQLVHKFMPHAKTLGIIYTSSDSSAVNKPVFPAVDTMVKQGGVATYSINQYKLGVEGGKLTADILKGKKKPSTTAIKYIRHGEPVLNLKQARKLGLHVPASFQREAEKYGEVIK